jgi:hypothetical protein
VKCILNRSDEMIRRMEWKDYWVEWKRSSDYCRSWDGNLCADALLRSRYGLALYNTEQCGLVSLILLVSRFLIVKGSPVWPRCVR